jgi:hypothetical protein
MNETKIFKLIADNAANNTKKIVSYTAQKLGKKTGKTFSPEDIDQIAKTALKIMEDSKSQPTDLSPMGWALFRWGFTLCALILTLRSEGRPKFFDYFDLE